MDDRKGAASGSGETLATGHTPAPTREAKAGASALARYRKILAPYREPTLGRSVSQFLVTLAGFAACWALAWWALRWSYGLTLMASVPAAGFLVRAFLLMHDCSHRSLFESRLANDWVGFALGVLTFTPFQCWRKSHAMHHATVGDLDRRGHGDIPVLTVGEYRRLPGWRRFAYRVYRHPAVLYGLGPLFYFTVVQRFPFRVPREWRKERASIYATNLAVAGLLLVMGGLVGWRALLFVQVPVTALATGVGIFLFTIQHQFDGTCWARSRQWDFVEANLHGSSCLQLPGVLRWFTIDIGLHHVHHLDTRIPNYRLHACFDAHPELQRVERLGLRKAAACTRLALWDEDARRMVGFAEAVRSEETF